MRKICFLSASLLFLSLFVACTEQVESVVYYSKDTLTNQLAFDNSKLVNKPNSDFSIINLANSNVFEKNMPYLNDIVVEKLSYKIIEVSGMDACLLKTHIIFDDNVLGTDLIDFKNFKAQDLGVEIEITNKKLLAVLASKLMSNKKITIYCKEDHPDAMPLVVKIEFTIAIAGTFVD